MTTRSASPRSGGWCWTPAARGEGRHLPWQDLPGRTLRMRSLGVVAVAVFDSVRMVPRICGRPLWRSAALVYGAQGHERRSTRSNGRPTPRHCRQRRTDGAACRGGT
jgi:hypothetical protein